MYYASSDMPRRSAPIFLGILLAFAGVAKAQPPIPSYSRDAARPVSKSGGGLGADTKPKEVDNKLPRLNLGDCLKSAFEKQPKLTALRASVNSSQLAQKGLEDIRLLGHLSTEYKYRKMQAANGIGASMAELEQAQHDVTQAVVWCYYSAVYAAEQTKVAKDAVDFVDYYRDQVYEIIKQKKSSKEINQITLDELVIRLSEGKRLLIKAQAGQRKAMAALREAMGVPHDTQFAIADTALPDFAKFEIKQDVIIEQAQARRGEVIMAGIAAEVTQLEAYVQWSTRFRLRVDTFASGADIHSRPLPTGMQNGDYRPGAVGPEMPARLVGNRTTRYQHAWELTVRSQAVAEKARNLVALEAENSVIDFEAAGLTMAEAKIEVERANANYMTLREVAGDKVSKAADLRNMLEAYASLAKAQGALNEAVYHRIAALAAIERISAGGIKVNYPNR